MSQKKRKTFSIEENSHVIWRLENGESNSEIAKECGVSHSTISTIWKNRDRIKVIEIDDSVAVCALATEEEILAEAENNNRNTDEENEDQQDLEEQFQPTTISETLNAVTVLQKFVAFNEQFDIDDTHTLRSIKRKMQKIFETGLKKRQTKMTDYFKN